MSVLSDAAELLAKIPEPLVVVAVDLVRTLFRSLAEGDSPAETAAKLREEATKLEAVQAAYHARAGRKFPDYRP